MISIKPTSEAKQYQSMVEQHGSPLLVLDCAVLEKQYKSLSNELPGVDLYYAIKSLPHPAVIQTLNRLGASFDIATTGEIRLLQSEKVSARNTIHTHPVKRDSDIRDALRFGCTTFVVDNIFELEKFTAYRHRVRLLIRVSFPNPNTPIDLSRKFGCREDEVLLLVQKAQSLGIKVKGLSFHAGSQSPDSKNHVYAIGQCVHLIKQVYSETGLNLSILDIGGGFPVQYNSDIADNDNFYKPVRKALQQLPENVHVYAEPGRYLSAPAMTSISSIMGKARRGDTTWYYLDDGIYGSYSGIMFDHASYPQTIFSDIAEKENAVLAGPTCDSIDVIAENIQLPVLHIGDMVIGHQMGAYTSATSTEFNLFDKAKIIVINQQEQHKDNIINL